MNEINTVSCAIIIFFFALCLTPGARLPVLGPQSGAFVPTLDQTLSNSDDRYSIPRRDSIHHSQKVQNLLNEKLTPL